MRPGKLPIWAATGAAILALLAATSAAAAAVKPASGATYPIGTRIQGICDYRPTGGDTYTVLTYPINGKWYVPFVGQTAPGSGDPFSTYEGCTLALSEPGPYRVYLVHRTHPDNHLDRVELVARFTVVAGGDNPCQGKENQITAVPTESGTPSGLQALQGSLLSTGQTIKADQNVTLTFGDGAILRLTQGSSFKVQGCDWRRQKNPIPFKMRLALILGKIWAKITPNKEHVEIRTERVVAGNRGTTFWISSIKGVTTVHVDKGTVTLSPRAGKGKWKPVSVTAGHTAIQKGAKAPAVKKAPVNNNPPF